jgi:hypothetical protein
VSFRFVSLLVLSLLFLAAPLAIFAEGAQEAEPVEVIATTAWTGAFAELAGIEDYTVLAPYELQHPPEHTLSPGEIAAISRAELIIYAGYEVMLERLKASTAADAQLVQIKTVNTPAIIAESVRAIAAVRGDQEIAEENLARLDQFFREWRQELAPYSTLPVIVHFHMRPMAEALGLNIVDVFGPAPLEAAQLKRLSESGAVLIIDNWHSDIGTPLPELLPEAVRAEWINFPGKDGTRSIEDVLRYNRRELSTILP